MKTLNLIPVLLFTTLVFISCEPRIDLDTGQWGDKAFITNVQIFGQEVKDDFQMAEYYENGDLTTGIRRILLTGTVVDIDNEAFKVTVTIPSGNDLSQSGFLITHTGTLVEPLEGAPNGGIIANLTSSSFKYKVYSADGTTHDWIITIREP